VAGHRRHDQHARLGATQRPGQLAIEVQQPAERLFPDGADFDWRAHAVDLGIVQAPFRLAVAARGALEQLTARGDGFAELGVRPRIERVLKQDFGCVGDGARRIERGLPHLVHPVHRRRQRRAAFTRQGRRAAKFTNRHMFLETRFCVAI